MSAVLEAQEPSARYLEAVQPALVRQFELLATAPGAVTQLRELILGLAVQGKLVRQDARDEPASDLLGRIAGERARLTAAGKLRKSKDSTEDDASEPPYLLPQGWAWSKLAAIGVINPRNDAADDVVASFVQMSSIPVAFNDPHTTEARPWYDIKSGLTQFAEGDVGVAKITPCFENGKSTVFQNLSNGIGAGTTELHIVRPLCGVEPRYVLLFLKSPRFLREGEAMMTGTAGQKRLPRSFFESCPFPLPPLAEQARIVARVDELMRLCDALEARGRLEAEQHARLLSTLLGTLTDSSTPEELAANWQRVANHFDLLLDRPEAVDALEQTILQLAVRGLLVPQDSREALASDLLVRVQARRMQLVREGKIKASKSIEPFADQDLPFAAPAGWEWIRAADACVLITDGDHQAPPRADSGVPFLVIGDVRDGAIGLSSATRFVPCEYFDSLDWGKKPLQGDILYTTVGSLGIPVPVVQQQAFCFQRHIALLRPGVPELQAYLTLALQSRLAFDQAESGATGIAQKTVPLSVLRSLRLPLPPLAEQARIVARVTELRNLCTALRQRLTASLSAQSHLAEALVAEMA